MLYNVEIGEYKVEYQANTFSAFSLDPTIVYSKNEQVYVLVPQGDFSAKKIILGISKYKNTTSYT
jgi:phage baseplate assembly protein gpV